jgi:YD repeat-containing protein
MFFLLIESLDARQGAKTVTRTEMALLALAALGVAAAAAATETITYTYDARGRLTKVVRTGTVNNNVSAAYAYDKADNRTTVNVVSPNSPP